MKEIIRSKNWNDFKNNISGLTTKGKGDAFELLVKYYLLLDPKYSSLLSKVWLFSEIPTKIHQRLNLPDRDMGIDLIGETKDHQYWAIQCKYRDNEEKQITWRDISTFEALAFSNKNISFALLCATVEKVTKVLDKQEGIGLRTIEVWRNLDADFFDSVRSLLKKKPRRINAYKPREHQQRAIRNASKHFVKENNNRGKLIMPCGAGKSLTAYWITNEINAKRTLIAVPSLSLLSQTIDVWLRENLANNKNITWLAVCSDETVAKSEKDEIALLTQDLGIPVVTDVSKISSWIKKNKKNNIVVFSTYQSGKVIAEASSNAKTTYDFGIFDEAHKTVGHKNKLFSHLLFDENIKVKNRLFMTATERRYAGGKSDKILSMENPEIYGETFELLSFKEALEYEPRILSDYRIVTIVVEESEIEELIRSNVFVAPKGLNIDKEIEAEMLASSVALRKAIKKYPINHTVSFHRSIKRSRVFQLVQDSLSESISDYEELETYHVDGKMTSGKRDKILNDFSLANRSLISNARCLTEGIDVKNIDGILFADPKKSKVDIVQAIGRALRPYKDKQYGYVIIPVITKGEQLESTVFDEILGVLRALATNDERIIEYFRAKFDKKRSTDDFIDFDIDEKIAQKIDIEKFIDSIETKCWASIAKLSWRPFKEARAFAQNLNLKSIANWRKYLKSGKNPDDIPNKPDHVYQNEGWISWGDWLGTGAIAPSLREFRPFKEARIFVHKLNLKSETEWRKYRKSGKKPDDIPTNPNKTYKNKGWKGFGDWLGTGTIAPYLIEYRPFKEARAFAHKLNLKSKTEWFKYCKSGEKPDDIPANPDQTYKNKGWEGFGDWLGTGAIAPSLREFRPFKEARAFAQNLNLKSMADWRKFCKSGKNPDDIPTSPDQTYKNKGWEGFGDWLGTGTIAPHLREFRAFKEARAFAQNLNLKSMADWRKFYKSGKKPDDIPTNPNKTYKNKGWKSWGDWLGTGTIAPFLIEYRPFKEARVFAQNLNLKSVADWRKFCESGEKPDDIPANPDKTYKNKGWEGFGDWLGTGTIASFLREYRPFKEARAFVHKLNLKSIADWRKYLKSGKNPDDIPATPNRIYQNEGWISWGDWLGTGTIAPHLREFRAFKVARAFAHKLNLKSQTEWFKYCKRGEKPDDIPANPNRIYQNEGWKSWGDWLGTGAIAPSLREFRPFKEARVFAQNLNVKSMADWRKFCKSGKKPDNIPAAPWRTYKNKGWKNMGDWLGKD